ncbi:hypothetical protein H7X87_01725 [Acetobacteraceae bacterium]|nr:hypothetical protein [Candidatus Parcubacteria bacterium]
MADIVALHTSAQKRLDEGLAIFPLDAAEKAIKGSGVFNPSDIKRLKPLVAKGLKMKRGAH